MRNCFFVLSLLLVIACAGCVHTPEAPLDARVTLAPGLGRSIYVTSVRCVKGSSGFYNFQANVSNNARSQARLEYKVQWLDADGLEIESALSTWQIMAIQPMEIKGLSAVAPSQEAVDFRFYVRPFRR